MVEQVTIVQGLSVGCILSLCGNQFNQRIILYIILTTSLWGNVSNGNVLTIAHTLLKGIEYNSSKKVKCKNTNEIVTTGSTENCESEKVNTEVENDKKVSFDNVTNVG